MPFTPLTFTGVSTYSDDLNTVLKRAVAIASLPLTAMQNADTDILSKKTALGPITSAVGALAASLTSLGTVANNKALSATSSTPSKVSVTYAGATTSATYTISEITSVASAASEVTRTGYADSTAAPVSIAGATPGTFKLTVGTQVIPAFTLDAAHNNLAGLADKINKLNVGVTASVITGTGANPNYLSVTANATGETAIRLVDDPDTDGYTGTNVDLLTTAAQQGTNARFKLNGITENKTSNVVTDAVSGAAFTILAKTDTSPAETVTLSLQTNRFQLQTALQDFVTKYNSVVDAVGTQIGSGGGLLTGDFLVRQVQDSLRTLTSYSGSGSGSIQSLAALDVEFGYDGKAYARYDQVRGAHRYPDLVGLRLPGIADRLRRPSQ